MELFRLLFLYVLSLTGFLCYGDSFSSYYGITSYEVIPVSQNGYVKAKFIYIHAQQLNELQEAIRTEWLQTNPGQKRTFLKAFGSNKLKVEGYYTDAEAFNYPFISDYINTEGYTEKIGDINDYTFYGEAHNVVPASLLKITPYVVTQNMMLIENNADIRDAMKQNNLEHEAVIPQTSHQFYIVEPIGGGGGAGGSVYRASIVIGI